MFLIFDFYLLFNILFTLVFLWAKENLMFFLLFRFFRLTIANMGLNISIVQLSYPYIFSSLAYPERNQERNEEERKFFLLLLPPFPPPSLFFLFIGCWKNLHQLSRRSCSQKEFWPYLGVVFLVNSARRTKIRLRAVLYTLPDQSNFRLSSSTVFKMFSTHLWVLF